MDRLPQPLLIALPHIINGAFVFALGACVGSFVNVVAIRLPMGMGLVHPPSRCVTCGRRLGWRENIPVVGWLLVRGRCWSCGSRVSVAYPAVELLMGALWAALYVLLFCASPRGWWGSGGAAWFQSTGMLAAAPAFLAICALASSLVAATISDLRTFLIPIQVTAWPTAIGIAAWTLQPMLGPAGEPAQVLWRERWPIPLPDWTWTGAAIGAAAGLAASNALLLLGRIRPSFHDYHLYIREGSPFADYPHARREILRECAFAAPAAAGAVAGALAARMVADASAPPPLVLASAAGSVLGYLAGAGIVWIVRALGTLAKGVEAMGMGDVHLMGAAGAVLGWVDPVVAFFCAPFIGLAWVAWCALSSRLSGGGVRREIPYGPHLALATMLLVLLRPAFIDAGKVIFPAWLDAGSGASP